METIEQRYVTGIQVSDAFGQRTASVTDVPAECTVGEFIKGLLADMRLPQNDADGRDIVYHARLEREGRHLHGSELVGDVLQAGDEVQLSPNIDAGSV
jgi:hypothetical protein